MDRLLHLDTAIITTKTVVRRFREDDGEALYQFIQNNWSWIPEYHRTPFLALKSANLAEFYCQQQLANWLLQKSYTFGVWDKESVTLIGCFCLCQIDWTLPSGYLQFWANRGLIPGRSMDEAMAAVLDFALKQLKLEKLHYLTLMDDYEGQRQVRKFGFGREGDLRGAFRLQSGDIIDIILFGITRAEFEKV